MDDDPVGGTMERLQGYVTLAITVAARIMEVQAHRRAQQLREAQRQGQEQARQVEAQQRAEATATKHQLRDVGRKEWWDSARPEDVATAYATARAYGQIDPELDGTARYMAEEIRRRYGVDADQLAADTAGTDVWMNAVGTDVGLTTSERTREQLDRIRETAAEQGEAVALVAEANAVEAEYRAFAEGMAGEMGGYNIAASEGIAASQERSEAAGDQAGRREGLAARLEALREAAPDGVEARLIADGLHERPVAQSTASAARSPRAGRAPAPAQARVEKLTRHR